MAGRGLGRGFDSLIPTDVLDETFDPTAGSDEKISELRYILVANITPNPHQPRREFDASALAELAESLRQHGMIQPIVVAAKGDGYQIVAGERRWRAAQLAGLDKIPALVRTLSNQHKLEVALIENLQREDLNPLETATAYLKLNTQFNLTHEEIAKRAGGKAVSTITNTIRLLRLPDNAKKALVEGDISEGHARQILALNDETVQTKLLNMIILNGWSVRKAEQFVVGYKKDATDDKTASAVKHTQSETDFTRQLGSRLQMKVMHKTTAHGGQIIISYQDERELERLQALLG
ncbi:ParB/RepB/Spo0J family partition protein [Candidatus Saccharibacteria bacterium]|nr:ParB/RepB/Spo0J family partition protein [Candidatus Saccharibacteria bacterium]